MFFRKITFGCLNLKVLWDDFLVIHREGVSIGFLIGEAIGVNRYGFSDYAQVDALIMRSQNQ